MIHVARDKQQRGEETPVDNVIKNLFKMCCGILNFNLRQRGNNQLKDEMLESYLDSIDIGV